VKKLMKVDGKLETRMKGQQAASLKEDVHLVSNEEKVRQPTLAR